MLRLKEEELKKKGKKGGKKDMKESLRRKSMLEGKQVNNHTQIHNKSVSQSVAMELICFISSPVHGFTE